MTLLPFWTGLIIGVIMGAAIMTWMIGLPLLLEDKKKDDLY